MDPSKEKEHISYIHSPNRKDFHYLFKTTFTRSHSTDPIFTASATDFNHGLHQNISVRQRRWNLRVGVLPKGLAQYCIWKWWEHLNPKSIFFTTKACTVQNTPNQSDSSSSNIPGSIIIYTPEARLWDSSPLVNIDPAVGRFVSINGGSLLEAAPPPAARSVAVPAHTDDSSGGCRPGSVADFFDEMDHFQTLWDGKDLIDICWPSKRCITASSFENIGSTQKTIIYKWS